MTLLLAALAATLAFGAGYRLAERRGINEAARHEGMTCAQAASLIDDYRDRL